MLTSSKCVDGHLAMEAVAVAISMARAEDCGADLPGAEQARQVLAGFRGRLYRCLTRRGDELFELGDAIPGSSRRLPVAKRMSFGPRIP